MEGSCSKRISTIRSAWTSNWKGRTGRCGYRWRRGSFRTFAMLFCIRTTSGLRLLPHSKNRDAHFRLGYVWFWACLMDWTVNLWCNPDSTWRRSITQTSATWPAKWCCLPVCWVIGECLWNFAPCGMGSWKLNVRRRFFCWKRFNGSSVLESRFWLYVVLTSWIKQNAFISARIPGRLAGTRFLKEFEISHQHVLIINLSWILNLYEIDLTYLPYRSD